MKILSKTITETNDAGEVVAERAGAKLSITRGDMHLVVTATGDGHGSAIDKLKPVCKAIEDGNQMSLPLAKDADEFDGVVFDGVKIQAPSGKGKTGALGFSYSDMTPEKRDLLDEIYEDLAPVTIIIQRRR
jgi:hypothetical protein